MSIKKEVEEKEDFNVVKFMRFGGSYYLLVPKDFINVYNLSSETKYKAIVDKAGNIVYKKLFKQTTLDNFKVKGGLN
jgi:hypothetical protein